jgi:putative CocE/NonD family hydrolase
MGYQCHGGVGGAGHAKLIIGPWDHDTAGRYKGDLLFPENAAASPHGSDLYTAMFAERLLGVTDYGDYRDFPAVTYYVMGDVNETSTSWNRWAAADDWPIAHTNLTLQLGAANALLTGVQSPATSYSYDFNPMDPVLTLGGNNLRRENRGPWDQRPVSAGRDDIIDFAYAIDEPLLITGRVWCRVFVSSNCTDTDVTAKLIDVYPDGREVNVLDGIVRMRFRNGQDAEVLMDGSGATVYEAWIDLWSTAYVFNADHTLKLSLSSSNYPRFDVNANTGADIVPMSEEVDYHVAHNTIHASAAHPSALVLPVPTVSPTFL